MEKVFKVLSAVIFAVVILGFVVLGSYIFFIKEHPVSGVGVLGDTPSQATKPVAVVGDVLAEQPKPQTLEKYAYKVEEKTAWLTYLFYLLGAGVAYYVLKQMIRFWGYLVKNSA
jgi:hypothetical protein